MKYKIKDCFVMKEIADEYVVIPRGTEALDFNATVVFNESGAFLWDVLLNPVTKSELESALTDKYNIDKETAEKDVEAFIKKMLDNGMLESV